MVCIKESHFHCSQRKNLASTQTEWQVERLALRKNSAQWYTRGSTSLHHGTHVEKKTVLTGLHKAPHEYTMVHICTCGALNWSDFTENLPWPSLQIITCVYKFWGASTHPLPLPLWTRNWWEEFIRDKTAYSWSLKIIFFFQMLFQCLGLILPWNVFRIGGFA